MEHSDLSRKKYIQTDESKTLNNNCYWTDSNRCYCCIVSTVIAALPLAWAAAALINAISALPPSPSTGRQKTIVVSALLITADNTTMTKVAWHDRYLPDSIYELDRHNVFLVQQKNMNRFGTDESIGFFTVGSRYQNFCREPVVQRTNPPLVTIHKLNRFRFGELRNNFKRVFISKRIQRTEF